MRWVGQSFSQQRVPELEWAGTEKGGVQGGTDPPQQRPARGALPTSAHSLTPQGATLGFRGSTGPSDPSPSWDSRRRETTAALCGDHTKYGGAGAKDSPTGDLGGPHSCLPTLPLPSLCPQPTGLELAPAFSPASPQVLCDLLQITQLPWPCHVHMQGADWTEGVWGANGISTW